MIDSRYIELAQETPELFIANYLLNYALADLPKWNHVDGAICDRFPYLSILYLFSEEEKFDNALFCKNYKEKIDKENDLFKSFSCHFSNSFSIENEKLVLENSELLNKLNKSAEEIRSIQKTYQDRISTLENKNKKLEEDFERLKKQSVAHLNNVQIFNNKEGLNSQREKDITINVKGNTLRMVFVEGGEIRFPEYSSLSFIKTKIRDFYCSETAVTQSLWYSVMGYNPSLIKGANYPVTNITFDECNGFIKRLRDITGKNFCLLSEKEWHYAAIGRNSKYRSHNKCSSPSLEIKIKEIWPRKVDNKRTLNDVSLCESNALGIKGMTGQLWEYVLDLNGRCKGQGSGFDESDYYFTTFSEEDGSLTGLRLALSPEESDDNYLYVDLGLSKSWSINESLEKNSKNRMPTPAELEELNSLDFQRVNDNVVRLVANNGNYVYVYNTWYQSGYIEGNKCLCFNMNFRHSSLIYIKKEYKYRYVKI